MFLASHTKKNHQYAQDMPILAFTAYGAVATTDDLEVIRNA